MDRIKTPTRIVLREQNRARHAYESVNSVPVEKLADYHIGVNDLGVNILRGGLCAALATLQRLGDRGALLLQHLAGSRIPGLEEVPAQDFVARVRELTAEDYMIATREALRVAMWLKRAAQARASTEGD